MGGIVSNPRIRVAIVDDHPALRDGTAVLLEQQGDIEVISCLDTLVAARELLASDRAPDVLVLDVRLAQERGLDLLGDIDRLATSRPAVVVWTGFDLPQYASYALSAGASGFAAKTAPLSELVTAIRAAAAGRLHFDRHAMVGQATLTPREREVLSRLVSGRSNDEMRRHWASPGALSRLTSRASSSAST